MYVPVVRALRCIETPPKGLSHSQLQICRKAAFIAIHTARPIFYQFPAVIALRAVLFPRFQQMFKWLQVWHIVARHIQEVRDAWTLACAHVQHVPTSKCWRFANGPVSATRGTLNEWG